MLANGAGELLVQTNPNWRNQIGLALFTLREPEQDSILIGHGFRIAPVPAAAATDCRQRMHGLLPDCPSLRFIVRVPVGPPGQSTMPR
jgi:hypothetical protein